MKEVTEKEFFAAIYARPENIHPRIEGKYPYTSIFEVVANRQEVGRIVDGGTNEPSKYFLAENNN